MSNHKSTVVKIGERAGEWTFVGNPTLPLQAHGEIDHPGWDIPTCWAIDADGRCWMDNAHGGFLRQRDAQALIHAAESHAVKDKFYTLLGLHNPTKPCPACNGSGRVPREAE